MTSHWHSGVTTDLDIWFVAYHVHARSLKACPVGISKGISDTVLWYSKTKKGKLTATLFDALLEHIQTVIGQVITPPWPPLWPSETVARKKTSGEIVAVMFGQWIAQKGARCEAPSPVRF